MAPIGSIIKTVGINGFLVVGFNKGLHTNFFDAMESVFLELEGKPVPFFPEQITFYDEKYARLKFLDINDVESAARLIKAKILIEKEYLNEVISYLDGNEELMGFEIYDKQLGSIGKISDIIRETAQDLLLVNNEKGEEILIPHSSELIQETNQAAKILYVDLPPGLIDLNKR